MVVLKPIIINLKGQNHPVHKNKTALPSLALQFFYSLNRKTLRKRRVENYKIN